PPHRCWSRSRAARDQAIPRSIRPGADGDEADGQHEPVAAHQDDVGPGPGRRLHARLPGAAEEQDRHRAPKKCEGTRGGAEEEEKAAEVTPSQSFAHPNPCHSASISALEFRAPPRGFGTSRRGAATCAVRATSSHTSLDARWCGELSCALRYARRWTCAEEVVHQWPGTVGSTKSASDT